MYSQSVRVYCSGLAWPGPMSMGANIQLNLQVYNVVHALVFFFLLYSVSTPIFMTRLYLPIELSTLSIYMFLFCILVCACVYAYSSLRLWEHYVIAGYRLLRLLLSQFILQHNPLSWFGAFKVTINMLASHIYAIHTDTHRHTLAHTIGFGCMHSIFTCRLDNCITMQFRRGEYSECVCVCISTSFVNGLSHERTRSSYLSFSSRSSRHNHCIVLQHIAKSKSIFDTRSLEIIPTNE